MSSFNPRTTVEDVISELKDRLIGKNSAPLMSSSVRNIGTQWI